MEAGPDLEWKVEREVALLSIDHPNFVVRLHGAGDFYSVAYVELWRTLLERHEGLHVFGYTARMDDAIADALRSLARDAGWSRFAMRVSNGPFPLRSTVTIESVRQKPADAIVCPEQTGRTRVVQHMCACAGQRRGASPFCSTERSGSFVLFSFFIFSLERLPSAISAPPNANAVNAFLFYFLAFLFTEFGRERRHTGL